MLPKNRKPTPPGEILLEEFLMPLDISQVDFVEYLGGSWTQPKLSAIINGKRAITVSIALDLSDTLGTSPEFWINLQNNVNFWEVKRKRKKIKRIPKLRRSRKKIINFNP
ncbi:MAG: putative HTH-type transcriptional regulator YbaQ [Chlamydiae bacterium]|nr:putative HTH-type transcriptional regulator YbaQ [Chlamydiota bacterium]